MSTYSSIWSFDRWFATTKPIQWPKSWAVSACLIPENMVGRAHDWFTGIAPRLQPLPDRDDPRRQISSKARWPHCKILIMLVNFWNKILQYHIHFLFRPRLLGHRLLRLRPHLRRFMVGIVTNICKTSRSSSSHSKFSITLFPMAST